MIDTHLHILPGIDDGPDTMEESVALAKALVKEGIYAAIATPHYNDLFPHLTAIDVQERVYVLQQELNRRGIILHLFAGHEVLIKPELIEDIQTGRIATLNGSRYLLLELWNNSWLPETERVIFELRAAGIMPILAHPERYRIFQDDRSRLSSLLKQGILVQMTVGSLLGLHGQTAQRTAETLLKRRQVHCIASDAHGLGRRLPSIGLGLNRVMRMIGAVNTQQLIEDYPSMIVNNEAYKS